MNIKLLNIFYIGNNYFKKSLKNIKNHYRLTGVDLSRQKELEADPKAIRQRDFVGQLNKN